MDRNACFCVTFSTNVATNFANLTSSLGSHCQKNPDSRFLFLALGRFDHMVLTLGNDLTELFSTEKHLQDSVCSESHMNVFGRILRNDSMGEDWATTINSNCLCGFATFRLSESFRPVLINPSSEQILLNRIVDKLKKHKVSCSIGRTSGWDDYAILIFARSFTQISNAIGSLRGLKRDQFDPIFPDNSKAVHAFVTSCTLPAIKASEALVECISNRQALQKNELRPSFPGIDFDTKDADLNWSIRIELRPGHWHGLVRAVDEQLGTPNGSKRKFDREKIFGQSDFRLSATSSSIGDLIDCLFRILFPLISDPDTAICSLDTHLHLPLNGYEEDTEATEKAAGFRDGEARHILLLEKQLADRCVEYGLPKHTIDSIQNLLKKLISLEDHYLLRNEFIHLRPVLNNFIQGIDKKIKKASGTEDRKKLSEHLGHWALHFEKALSDRYSGAYPTGENIHLRLGSYPSSFSKFVNLVDNMASLSSYMIFGKLKQIFPRQQEVDNPDCEHHCLLSLFGTSPNPTCDSSVLEDFGVSFIDLPIDFMLHRKELIIVAHEVGHHVFESFLCKHSFDVSNIDKGKLFWDESFKELIGKAQALDPNVNWTENLAKKIKKNIGEIYADLFSLVLCSAGNAYNHCYNTESVIKRIFPDAKTVSRKNKVHRSIMLNALYKLKAAVAVFECLVDGRETKAKFVDYFSKDCLIKKEIERHSSGADQIAMLKFDIAWTGALIALTLHTASNEGMKCLLFSTCDIATSTSFLPSKDGGALRNLRAMLAEPAALRLSEKIESLEGVAALLQLEYMELPAAERNS